MGEIEYRPKPEPVLQDVDRRGQSRWIVGLRRSRTEANQRCPPRERTQGRNERSNGDAVAGCDVHRPRHVTIDQRRERPADVVDVHVVALLRSGRTPRLATLEQGGGHVADEPAARFVRSVQEEDSTPCEAHVRLAARFFEQGMQRTLALAVKRAWSQRGLAFVEHRVTPIVLRTCAGHYRARSSCIGKCEVEVETGRGPAQVFERGPEKAWLCIPGQMKEMRRLYLAQQVTRGRAIEQVAGMTMDGRSSGVGQPEPGDRVDLEAAADELVQRLTAHETTGPGDQHAPHGRKSG